MTRETALLREIVAIGFHPQEVSLVSFILRACTARHRDQDSGFRTNHFRSNSRRFTLNA
jgi:hypothetical protein